MKRFCEKFEEDVLKEVYDLFWDKDEDRYYKGDGNGGYYYPNPAELVGILLQYFYRLPRNEGKDNLSVFYSEGNLQDGNSWGVCFRGSKLPGSHGSVYGDTLLATLSKMVEELYHASN